MTDDNQARTRFLIIQLMRLGGVALVVFSLLVINHALPFPEIVGWPLLVIGLIEIFLIPRILARMWRTPL
ncbi:hypothetical protein NT2_05_03320 [Caenibius tardaugens NBRC 16725]|uniref:Uncharacterized protein n=1 Tax=Caenibius tardaugens NBRC 16725 TaxID=1219035 RepID=U2Y873_9SPHN|nr:hypothetical protein [Caenibius tardaugens]AZI36740.1 hypothetical protein EGO55_12910 [Caenibius tardaugens NBRC 16725]GAD49411.1 hypothetical protein NT2_05_03320 [Caenibius tardaugens NBRC 16725]